MIAIYARQSVDKKDSISIQTQIDTCRDQIGSTGFCEQPVREYADKGYSGKNTDRPQFQAMMQDICKGAVSVVVVYRLDRCSRSVVDFANFIQTLKKHGTDFISCSEKFDTSSPMGRAMMDISMVFAQMERETIQQRVTDAYRDRSRQGFYMGGPAPYGYAAEKIILNGIHTKRFVENPTESEHIRMMYQMYADPKYSLGDIVKYFSEHGIQHARGKHWSTSRISDTLKNPVYVRANADVYRYFASHGTEIASPPEQFNGVNGCYLFQPRDDNNSRKRTSRFDDKYLVLAPHEGIIPAELWLQCRKRCAENRQSTRTNKPTRSWLLGKVKCGNCGSRLDVARSQTKRGRYFMCGLMRDTKKASCQGTGSTLYADVLEEQLSARIKEKLGMFKGIQPHLNPDETNALEINTLKNQINQLEIEQKLWIQKIPLATDAVMLAINENVSRIQQRLTELQGQLAKLTQSADAQIIAALSNFADCWDALSFADKQAVVDALIEIIYVKNGEITVKWKI